MLLGRTSDAKSRPTDACGHEYLGWAAGRTLPGEQAETVRRRPRDVASEPAAGTSDASGLRAQGRLGACGAGSAPERRAAKRRRSRFDEQPRSPNWSPFALPPARSSCPPPETPRRAGRTPRRAGRKRGASAADVDPAGVPQLWRSGSEARRVRRARRRRSRRRMRPATGRRRHRPRRGAEHRGRERKKVPRGPCRQPRGTGVACVCRRIRRAPRT